MSLMQQKGYRRLAALVRKESLQMTRDPSTFLIAFALPAVLLFLFAFAVSLDLKHVPLGLVIEKESPAALSLAAAFSATSSFRVTQARDRRELEPEITAGRLKGMVVLPQDFEQRLRDPRPIAQVLCDGSQPNTSGFVANYARGVVQNWARNEGLIGSPRVEIRPRYWYNPEIESRQFLLPGAIAIIMTMIGTLLTSLVIAREWERGTMEALLSTPARIPEILLGKLLPYFVLGLLATLISSFLAVGVFGIPMQGSWFSLLLLASVFLVPALGQGLLISTLAPNQFLASQLALFTGFLPAFLLSGFLFEIDSMPAPVRAITAIVPARYFVASLQTVFLAGDIWSVLLKNMAAMLGIGAVFGILVRLKTKRSLER